MVVRFQSESEVWDLWCKVERKCRQAITAGRQYICVLPRKGGDFHLVATNRPGDQSSYRFQGFGSQDWADNVLDLLADLGFVDRATLDALWDKRSQSGYGD